MSDGDRFYINKSGAVLYILDRANCHKIVARTDGTHLGRLKRSALERKLRQLNEQDARDTAETDAA